MCLHGPRRTRSQDHQSRLHDDPARLRLEPVAGEPGRDLAAAHRVITPTAGSPQPPTDLAHFGDDARHKGVPRPPRARPWWTWPDPEALGRLAISRAHRGLLWDKAEQHAAFGVWQRLPPIQQHGATPRRVPHQPLCRQPSDARCVRTLQSCPRFCTPFLALEPIPTNPDFARRD